MAAALSRALAAGAKPVVILALVEDDGTTNEAQQHAVLSSVQQQLDSLLESHNSRLGEGSSSASVNMVMVTGRILEDELQLLRVLMMGRAGLPPLHAILPSACLWFSSCSKKEKREWAGGCCALNR